jgi:hypothetical protein
VPWAESVLLHYSPACVSFILESDTQCVHLTCRKRIFAHGASWRTGNLNQLQMEKLPDVPQAGTLLMANSG